MDVQKEEHLEGKITAEQENLMILTVLYCWAYSILKVKGHICYCLRARPAPDGSPEGGAARREDHGWAGEPNGPNRRIGILLSFIAYYRSKVMPFSESTLLQMDQKVEELEGKIMAELVWRT